MPPIEEIKTAAELKQEPPKFVPSTEGLPAPMDDNAIRDIFANAAAQGVDDLNATVTTPGPIGQPVSEPEPKVETPIVEIPAKFQKPDGTVDEEKLKASSAQLDAAIEQKQKTVEEMLADYRAKEKEFHGISAEAKQLQASQPPAPVPPSAPAPGTVDPNMDQVRQQLLNLQRQDPIAFAVEIARAVALKEAAPALQMAQTIAEKERDSGIRANIASLAEQDPRILNPQIYAEVTKELNSDPAYFRLKNPHKAAWNEVKERLRLGDAPQRQAQPSTPGPILGRGSPTPVSGLSQPATPQSMFQQVGQVDPYSEEGKRLEAQLRQASESLWRS